MIKIIIKKTDKNNNNKKTDKNNNKKTDNKNNDINNDRNNEKKMIKKYVNLKIVTE